MKVVVYRDTANNSYYHSVMEKFANGIKVHGDEVILHEGFDVVEDNDLAVIFGSWKNTVKEHHYFKEKIIRNQIEKGKNFIVIETPILARKIAMEHEWWRVGYNHYLYDFGHFCNENSPPDRWNDLKEILNIEVKPWRERNSGAYILVMLQLPGDASLRDEDINCWMLKTVDKIRRNTPKPIVIRPHPTIRNYDWEMIDIIKRQYQNVRFEGFNTISLEKSLDNAELVVCKTSGSAIDAVVAGVPVLITDSGNLTYPVANNNFKYIKTPSTPDREQFFADLAYAQWHMDEMEDGSCWEHLKDHAFDDFGDKFEKNHPLRLKHPFEKETSKMMKKAKEEKTLKYGSEEERAEIKRQIQARKKKREKKNVL